MVSPPVKFKTERRPVRGGPVEGVRKGDFCERCSTFGVLAHTLHVIEKETTLGHPLRFTVCINEQLCTERARAQAAEREHRRAERVGPPPPARVSDLYPD